MTDIPNNKRPFYYEVALISRVYKDKLPPKLTAKQSIALTKLMLDLYESAYDSGYRAGQQALADQYTESYSNG